MVEPDGTRRTPDFFVPYVTFILLAGLLTPAAGVEYLIWQGQPDLGICTLGSYVACAFIQIATESTSLRLGQHIIMPSSAARVCILVPLATHQLEHLGNN